MASPVNFKQSALALTELHEEHAKTEHSGVIDNDCDLCQQFVLVIEWNWDMFLKQQKAKPRTGLGANGYNAEGVFMPEYKTKNWRRAQAGEERRAKRKAELRRAKYQTQAERRARHKQDITDALAAVALAERVEF